MTKFNSQICTSRNKGGGVIKHHKVYALKGNEFYEFNSVPEAAEKTGCCKTKIYKCCNGKQAYTGGYVWSYQPLDIPTEVEEWRDVKGYENLYQVNRKGEVRSSHKGYWEVLTTVVNRQGYNQYLFHKDGKRKNMRGNRLVAEAFIPNPDNLPFVNHKDENPTNNNVSNLEWCTYSHNTKEAYRLGLIIIGEKHKKQIRQLCYTISSKMRKRLSTRMFFIGKSSYKR